MNSEDLKQAFHQIKMKNMVKCNTDFIPDDQKLFDI